MRSHTIAVYDADGKIHTVNADEIRMCAPTSKCIKFWVQFASALIVIGLGTFFMVWQGTSSLYFNIGEALLSLGVGILIPSPKYSDVVPRRLSASRPSSPARDESETTFQRARRAPSEMNMSEHTE